MDIGALIAGGITAVAAIVGIVAGIVQVTEYLQKRRERKRAVESLAESPSALDVSTDDDHQPWIDQTGHAQKGLAFLMEIRGEYESALAQAREALATYERLGLRRDIRETRALIDRLEAKLSTDSGNGWNGLDTPRGADSVQSVPEIR